MFCTDQWDSAVSQTGGMHQLRHWDLKYQPSSEWNDHMERSWACEQTALSWFPVLYFILVTFSCVSPSSILSTVSHTALRQSSWSANNMHHKQNLLSLHGGGFSWAATSNERNQIRLWIWWSTGITECCLWLYLQWSIKYPIVYLTQCETAAF